MIRKHSYASVRDRVLVPVSVEQIFDKGSHATPPAQIAYAAYQEALQRYFRGHSTMAEVGIARLAWCAAESREVERRVRGGSRP